VCHSPTPSLFAAVVYAAPAVVSAAPAVVSATATAVAAAADVDVDVAVAVAACMPALTLGGPLVHVHQLCALPLFFL